MGSSSKTGWMVAAALIVVVVLPLLENLASASLYTLTLHLPGIDKALHFAQSFLFCFVVASLLGRTRASLAAGLIGAAAVALAGAGFDELQQSLRSDRHVEVADIGAGASGILVAVSIFLASTRPRLAMATAMTGVLAGSAIGYQSYLLTAEFNQGLLAERDGRREDALRHYINAANSGIDNPEAYNAAAWLIAESGAGEPWQAVEYARRSLQLRPGNADTLDTYGWSLYRAGRAGDALAPLEEALAAKPEMYCIHYHLGMTHLALGDRVAAEAHLQRQIELMPDTREASLAGAVLASLDPSPGAHR